jgi:hypothetical protein
MPIVLPPENKGIILGENNSITFDVYRYGGKYCIPAITSQFFQHYEVLNMSEVRALDRLIFDLVSEKILPENTTLDSVVMVLSEEEYNSVSVVNWPKIEVEEFLRLVKLYQHYCSGVGFSKRLEVGTLFYYHPDYGIKIVLPTQTVTPGHWDWDLVSTKYNTKTRETVIVELPLTFLDPKVNEGKTVTKSWLAENGWTMVGTSHSHNTMDVSWSGTRREKIWAGQHSSDDYSSQAGSTDQPKPPLLHLLVRGFKNFENLDVFPQFDVDVAVNIYGDLLGFDLSETVDSISSMAVLYEVAKNLEFQEVYKNLDWCGIEIAESLATIPVYQPPKSKYKAQTPALPPARNYPATPTLVNDDIELIIEGDIAKEVYETRRSALEDSAETAYLHNLILDLLNLLAVQDQVEVIAALVQCWRSRPEYQHLAELSCPMDILALLCQNSDILKEAVQDTCSLYKIGETFSWPVE